MQNEKEFEKTLKKSKKDFLKAVINCNIYPYDTHGCFTGDGDYAPGWVFVTTNCNGGVIAQEGFAPNDRDNYGAALTEEGYAVLWTLYHDATNAGDYKLEEVTEWIKQVLAYRATNMEAIDLFELCRLDFKFWCEDNVAWWPYLSDEARREAYEKHKFEIIKNSLILKSDLELA